MLEQNLKNIVALQKLLDAMNPDTLTSKQALDFFEKVMQKVLNNEKQMTEALNKLEQTYGVLLDSQGKKHDQLMADLKKQVDALFVGTKLEQMVKEHTNRMTAVDEKLKTIKNGKDGTNPNPRLVAEIVRSQIKEELDAIKEIKDLKEELKAIKEIKDLKEELKAIKNRPVVISGSTGRDFVRETDISASLNGSTKTFNIGAFHRILSIDLSSYPYGSLRKNTDYTYDGNAGTITFTSAIDAATQLASGQSCVVTFVVS